MQYKDLPKTIIITQETFGPTISINKAVSLSTGDLQFVEGDEIIHPNATSVLIDACTKLRTQVALGLTTSKGYLEEYLDW